METQNKNMLQERRCVCGGNVVDMALLMWKIGKKKNKTLYKVHEKYIKISRKI